MLHKYLIMPDSSTLKMLGNDKAVAQLPGLI